jgi:hypothetical protein
MRTARGTRVAGLALAVLAVATATGCGSGAAPAGGSGGGSAAASAAGGGGGGTPEDAVRWARCMREQGVDVPDPAPGAPVRITGDGRDAAAMDAATKACAAYAPKLDLDPARQQQVQQEVLAFTRCMREHGVDLPDPQARADGSVVIGRPGQGGRVPDPQSPAFRQAQEACASLLPKPPAGQP